uniref:Uncharacterized protein n=1 Tax=Romanomermis culicivorax TaxID=13658 RepID=A0A915ICZ7_ROMCU
MPQTAANTLSRTVVSLGLLDMGGGGEFGGGISMGAGADVARIASGVFALFSFIIFRCKRFDSLIVKRNNQDQDETDPALLSWAPLESKIRAEQRPAGRP